MLRKAMLKKKSKKKVKVNGVEFLEKEQAYLSNERTLLSFIRTSLTFILVGLGIYTLSERTNRVYIAFLFIAVGILFGLYGYRNFKKVNNLITRM